MTTQTHDTREQWLNALANALRPAFKAEGKPLPEKLRLSCGFTSHGNGGKRIGECWHPEASTTQHVEIFIKPDQDVPMRVADIVLHELCHAALGKDAKHGPQFRVLATSLGLEGKMVATVAGAKAIALLQPIVDSLGPYPHSALAGMAKKKEESKSPKWKTVTCPCCDFKGAQLLETLEKRLRCPIDGEYLLMKDEEGFEGGDDHEEDDED